MEGPTSSQAKGGALGKSNQNNGSKAAGNNKRKKKNQRKKSCSSSSSGSTSVSYSKASDSPSVAINIKTDLVSDSLSVSSAESSSKPVASSTLVAETKKAKVDQSSNTNGGPKAVSTPISSKSSTKAAKSAASPKSTTTPTKPSEPKCQKTTTSVEKKSKSAVEEIPVESEIVSPKSEEEVSTLVAAASVIVAQSVTSAKEVLEALEPTSDASDKTTDSQTKSSQPAVSSASEKSSNPSADSSCELTQPPQPSKESSSESTTINNQIGSQASSDQSMDDVDLKAKMANGVANGGNKSYAQQNGTGESVCKICSKHVYQMEQIKAEKSVFHMACFRCQECKKQLKVDSYSSHEGVIYCKAHFKQLLQPKPVIGNDSNEPKNPAPRKHELIIAENTPQELPADVVRSSTRQEDVFENINLDLSNIRNRFENGPARENNNSTDRRKSSVEKGHITRSESIHKIMQKYQSRVAGDKEINSSSDEEDNSSAKSDEQQTSKVAFSGMSALKTQWESGSINGSNKSEKERVEEELAEIRQKVKTSEPLKQAYERAVQEAKSVENLAQKSNETIHLDSSAKAVKEKFEKGKVEADTIEEDRIRAERGRKEREEEISRIAVSESSSTKEARNKFKQIEANMNKQEATSNGGANGHEETHFSSNELQQRIKNFENIKDTQSTAAKEGDHHDVIDANVDDIPKADTTKKMLDKFKALEAGQTNNGPSNGAPKSPIRMTPPREAATKSLYESEPAAERDPNIVRSSYKTEDDIQVEPEKAKNLRAKFENWQTVIEREGRKSENEDDYVPNIDTTKNLRAMFESIKDEYKPAEKPRPRVNRFVENKAPPGEVCYVCSSRLYPMEKMEFSGIKIHKNCFRCNKCHAPLRLDNFTVTAEKLFCIPHFKQLFMEKGNYDEGFGLEQHKDKWSNKVGGGSVVGQTATNGTSNGIEKLANGDEEAKLPTTNGNGVHHDEEENLEEDVDIIEHANGTEGHQTEEEVEEPYTSHEEEPEELVKLQQHVDEDLDVLQQQVGHLELDEAILDGPLIAVDN